MRSLLLSCWLGLLRHSQNIQPIAIALGYSRDVTGKSILLKTPCTSATEAKDPGTETNWNISIPEDYLSWYQTQPKPS